MSSFTSIFRWQLTNFDNPQADLALMLVAYWWKPLLCVIHRCMPSRALIVELLNGIVLLLVVMVTTKACDHKVHAHHVIGAYIWCLLLFFPYTSKDTKHSEKRLLF